MKKTFLLYLIFSTNALCQNVGSNKINIGFKFQANSIPLNIDNLLEKIASASYSEGVISKSKLNFGFGLDGNINRFYCGLDLSFKNLTTKSFESKNNFLDIKSTVIMPLFGRNFWLKKNTKITLAAGPYFQDISLDIKPKISTITNPKTLVDFLSSPDINLKKYSVSSALGGINTQLKIVKYFIINNSKNNEKFGISTFASINYRNQIVDNGNWQFSISQNTSSNNNNNTNNSSQSTTLKFPNKHDFETSGILFSVGVGYWWYEKKEQKKSKVSSLASLL